MQIIIILNSLISGAFLIPYFIAMLTCGIPLFLLEVSVGQYLGVGGMSVVGQLCPILKGVGYSAITMVFLENVYYIIIVAWTLFYILNTFYTLGSGLPWSTCEKGSKYYCSCNLEVPKPRFLSIIQKLYRIESSGMSQMKPLKIKIFIRKKM